MAHNKMYMAALTTSILCLCLSIEFVLLTQQSFAWPGTVVSVLDGDTVTVSNEKGELYKVRIYGVDTPELKQPWGEEAQAMTLSLLEGKTVEVIAVSRDRYKRQVAGIILLEDMLVLQDVLVSAGLAWVDNRYCKIDACKLWILHQTDAKRARRGLWSASDTEAPWDWRRENKKKR